MPNFFLRLKTRSQFALQKGTSHQAIEYITDDHDSKRVGKMNNEMIAYIARIDLGYKTDLEGGRVALYGHGVMRNLVAVTEEEVRAFEKRFHEWEIPPLQPCPNGRMRTTTGTVGYKETALTFSKELSLFCETQKQKARAAITRAIDKTLEDTYRGKDVAALSAMHTRNKAGDVHFNTHLLIGKFGRDRETGARGSLNYAKFMGGDARDAPKMKEAWTKHFVEEMEKEFGIVVKIKTVDGKMVCDIVSKENVPLRPLTRATVRERQRAYEMANSPMMPTGEGKKEKQFEIKLMDAKILEVASRSLLNEENFTAIFPKHAKTWGTFEKRIATLQKIGYLNERLRPSKQFREHAEAFFGHRPEFGQIKADTDNYVLRMADSMLKDADRTVEAEVHEVLDTRTTDIGHRAPQTRRTTTEEKPEPSTEPTPETDTAPKTAGPMPSTYVPIRVKTLEDLDREAEEKRKAEEAAKETRPAPFETEETRSETKQVGMPEPTTDDTPKKRPKPVTLEDALHRHPLEFARDFPDLLERINRIDLPDRLLNMVEAMWTKERREVTPDLRKWAENERRRHKFLKLAKERQPSIPPEKRADYAAKVKLVADEMLKEAVRLAEEAMKSLEHETIKQRDYILREIRVDRLASDAIKARAEELKKKKEEEKKAEAEDKYNWRSRYYDDQIRELERTGRKIDVEIEQKRKRAFKMEKEIWCSAPTHRRRAVGRDNRVLDATVVAEMRQKLFNRRHTWHEAHTSELTTDVKLQVGYLRRGMVAMEIMGGEYNLSMLKKIRTFWGSDEYLLLEVNRDKLPKPMTIAAMMAKTIGEVLEKAESNQLQTTFDVPKRISEIPDLGEMMSRLLARCRAMGIQVPPIMGLNPEQFRKAAAANKVMKDLTSLGAEWIVHFKWQGQREIIEGLSALNNVQGMGSEMPSTTINDTGSTLDR
jgi:hypothetical protein